MSSFPPPEPTPTVARADSFARLILCRPPPPPKPKTEKAVQSEIRDVMKQITSSVSFLPMLDEPCRSTAHLTLLFVHLPRTLTRPSLLLCSMLRYVQHSGVHVCF